MWESLIAEPSNLGTGYIKWNDAAWTGLDMA